MNATAVTTLNGVALDERPTRELPRWQLVEISLYWLGINLVIGGAEFVLQPRIEAMVPVDSVGAANWLITLVGMVVAVLVQPTLGAISDHTISRWGRRKPYILIGAALDVVFMAGIGLSDTFISLVAFFALLQFSSNFAQGPFQGYVPDLVPAKQVSLASALMGLMIVLGRVVGAAIGTVGLITGNWVLACLGMGLLELGTAVVTLLTVDEGSTPRPRGRSSWREIVFSAWGLDILRERSFLWLLASRLFVLGGPFVLTRLIYYYLTRSHGLDTEATALWTNIALVPVSVMMMIATIPSARLSERFGRKAMIYASCAIGSVGMLGLAFAPTLPVAVAFAAVVGIAAGSFLAVDWALMTDLIPKAESGRYMGISNVASGASGPIALWICGFAMDLVTRVDLAAGPRVAYLTTLGLYALGALLLRPVRERR